MYSDQSTLINSFKNQSKKNLIKLPFMNKYLHKKSNLYVDKKTGLVRSDLSSTPTEILDIWSNKIFTSSNINDYDANLPFAKSRLFYTALTVNNFLKKNRLKNRTFCDYASGQGILIECLKSIDQKSKIIATEGSKKLSRFIERKYNIECLNTPLGNSSLSNFDRNRTNQPNFGFLNWTLCNCIDPLSVLNDIHNHLENDSYLCVSESSRILVPFRKKLNDYFNKRYIADIHPWHFSYNSISALLGISGFDVIYHNRYQDSDVMLVIAKKTKKIRKKFKIDNYKNLIKFFRDWDKITSFKYY